MDNHFEVMWDLFRSILSIQNPGETIFSEYQAQCLPELLLCRVTELPGQTRTPTSTMNLKATQEPLHLFMATDEELDKTIDDVFTTISTRRTSGCTGRR